MSTTCIVERADWDEVWDENTRLKAELRAARREAREWKAAHAYAMETIRVLSERVPAPAPEEAAPRCTWCGAREESHTDIVDGVRGHRIHAPEDKRLHGVWHAFTTVPVTLPEWP